MTFYWVVFESPNKPRESINDQGREIKNR